VQVGDHEGQEIRAEGLHHADADRSRQHGLPAPGDFRDLRDIREDTARARGDLVAFRCHHDAGAGPLHQLHAEFVLKLRELGRQRGLGDIGAFGGATEMQRLRDERDVSELLKAGHRVPLIDIIYQSSPNIRLEQSGTTPYVAT
jgi:hypothetical protein